MKVAEDVFNRAGQLILQRDTLITDKAITRLRFHSISSIKIYEENQSPAAASTAAAQTETYLEKLRKTPEFVEFTETFESVVDDFKDTFERYINNSAESDTKFLLNDVKLLLSKCQTGIHAFDLLHCLRGYDDQTFVHCLNVGIICGILGSWLGYDKKDIDTLILCGVFHDIGKLAIPDSIIKKPGKLTADEYNLVKTHALKGYNILHTRNIDKRIPLAAMSHHERCDGSGYPLGLKSNQIDDFTKIVSIADVYDAMTANRVYRNGLSPFEVISIFETEGLAAYDTKFVMTFIDHITQSYLGTKVLLSDGRQGTIVLLNKQRKSRPFIQVGDQYINLDQEHNLYIEKIL